MPNTVLQRIEHWDPPDAKAHKGNHRNKIQNSQHAFNDKPADLEEVLGEKTTTASDTTVDQP